MGCSGIDYDSLDEVLSSRRSHPLALRVSARSFNKLIFGLVIAFGASADEATWSRTMETGGAAFQRGAYAEASSRFEQAVAAAEPFGESSWRLAGALHNLGDTYRVQGRYPDAAERLGRAILVYASAFGTAQLQIRLDRSLMYSHVWPADKLKIVDE